MADQAVLKYLSIDTTFDPCYLSLDSTFNVETLTGNGGPQILPPS